MATGKHEEQPTTPDTPPAEGEEMNDAAREEMKRREDESAS